MPRVRAAELEQLTVAIFQAVGAPEAEAEVVGRHLVDANLAGHDSHGVLRVPQYVAEIRAGKIRPGVPLTVLDAWDTGCVLDAAGAFGQVACGEAMARAIERARRHGLAAVTLRRANHTGRLGAYVETAARANLIGAVLCNAGGGGQWVAPFGGLERRLGTNPLAVGCPSGREFPIVLDMGTSVVPEGKVRHHVRRGVPVPDGWLIDGAGRPTNDPRQLYEGNAALLPFGGQAGHKGSGLAFVIDLLAGALSGTGCCRPGVQASDCGHGVLVLALDVARFAPLGEYLTQAQTLTEYVQGCPPLPGVERVLVPGEFEHQHRQRRLREGIDIPPATWDELRAVAGSLGCASPRTMDVGEPVQ
jgi:uncharacterized oxidoreductase